MSDGKEVKLNPLSEEQARAILPNEGEMIIQKRAAYVRVGDAVVLVIGMKPDTVDFMEMTVKEIYDAAKKFR